MRSPTALMAAALKHEPLVDEFDEAADSESRAGRIRFRSDFAEAGFVEYVKVA